VGWFLLLGLLAGGTIPALSVDLLAGLVGFVGYGISLALFVLALRHLGAPAPQRISRLPRSSVRSRLLLCYTSR
jgi:hypothetical protein